MRSHEEYKEMLTAHALDVLETAEARAIEDHLSTCAACRDELDAWKETAGLLAFTADATMPSRELRTRILERAHVLSNSAIEKKDGLLEAIPRVGAKKSSNVIPLLNRAHRSLYSQAFFRAIAASLIIALLMVAIVIMWQRKRAIETEMARVSRQVDETQRELARLREEKQFFTSPTARVASLSGTEMAKEARAMIAYDHLTGRAMLVANGLPQAPAGKAYQLWFIPEGKQPMPGGVFATDATGHAELRDVVPPEGRSAAVFCVTLERDGGVPAPQGKAYLLSKGS